MRARTASSNIVARGFRFDEVSLGLAQKYMSGTMTAADIIREVESTWGSVGIWWGSVGNTSDDFYGSADQARDYAGWSGDGSIEERWEDMLDLTGGQVDPSGWIEAEIRVVLVAKKPMRDYGIWNPTTENGNGSIWESTSFFAEGEQLELTEVHYAADRSGNNWKMERVSGLTVTAQDYFMDHRPAGPDYGGPMHDVSEFFPDITTLPVRIYDFGEPGSQGSIRQIIDAQGNPGKPVTIYRTVPKGVTTSIQSGDWVTISREYAEQHGRSNAGGNYDVLSATVSAQDLWTSGDSVNEWGYHGPELRTAGTEYAPGPVYRGINTDMLTDDELDEIEEWAAANAYSQNNYQLAEPNYELIHRIVDRFERSGLGRHWSKDYDVSASFAQDQGDNIAIIFIGDWNGQGVDDREFHRGWDGVQRPSNVEHEKEVTLMPGTNVTLVGLDIIMPNGFTSNIPVPTIQVTASRTAADLPPGLRMENPKPNQVVAYDDGNPDPWLSRFGVAVLSWDNDGIISWVAIQDDSYKRRGIATAMLEYARTIRPDIKHSDELSESGAGWAQAVGSRTAYVSDDIYESYYDTDRLVALVMNAYTWDGNGPLWELVANSPEEAKAFFDSLDEDERRWNVAEVFENGGWDVSGIGNKFATRTAAEPGGVLPWNPSHRGYTWITKTDGTLEAVTNDGVNRMYLHDEGYGWTWEVFDDIGLVERGNFGTALKGGDALRDRANDLLAEFDTRAERRTRGPSRGYQDDYTQAPNQLWGRRVALHHETGNDDGVAIVLTFPLEYREHLAMPEGSPAEELHITLGYFGSISEQDPDSKDDLRHACAWTASYLDSFIVSLGGLIRFSGEDQDAFVLNADSPEIDSVRSVLLGWLDASGRRPDDTHGFTPHMTLGYLGHDDPLPFDRWEPLEVPVTAIELWYGTDRHIYPLGIDTVQAGRKTTSQRYAERLRKEGRR